MPYIKRDDGRREALQAGVPAQSAGELNYQIFYYIKHTQNKRSDNIRKLDVRRFVGNFLMPTPNYQKYNDMTGALIRCQKELKRRLKIDFDLENIMESYDRVIDVYEDTKIVENGDVE